MSTMFISKIYENKLKSVDNICFCKSGCTFHTWFAMLKAWLIWIKVFWLIKSAEFKDESHWRWWLHCIETQVWNTLTHSKWHLEVNTCCPRNNILSRKFRCQKGAKISACNFGMEKTCQNFWYGISCQKTYQNFKPKFYAESFFHAKILWPDFGVKYFGMKFRLNMFRRHILWLEILTQKNFLEFSAWKPCQNFIPKESAWNGISADRCITIDPCSHII